MKSWLIGKDSDAGKDWGAGGEVDDRGWDSWMTSLTRWTWFEWIPGVGDGQGGLACCDSCGCKESDTSEQLIWSGLISFCPISILPLPSNTHLFELVLYHSLPCSLAPAAMALLLPMNLWTKSLYSPNTLPRDLHLVGSWTPLRLQFTCHLLRSILQPPL